MLVCISANPAIDRRLRIDSIGVGEVNRASSAQPFPGGKAAHVAMVAKSLGLEVMWVGFLGGANGEQCESGLLSLRVPMTVIRTESETRANLEIISADGKVTEILEPGGAVTDDEVERLLATCRDLFAESHRGTQVALSGSLPPGAPADLYAQITRLAHLYNFRVLLDSSGEPLREALAAAPELVKPNRDEAAHFAGSSLADETATAQVAQAFFDSGAKSVAISLGAEGIFWQPTALGDCLLSKAPTIDACSSVGCGDAVLAGFAVAHERGLGEEETVRFATACGSANCFANAPGRVKGRDVWQLLENITVRRVARCESSRSLMVDAQ